MNKSTIFIVLGLFISGCVATSETVKPTSLPEKPVPVIQEPVPVIQGETIPEPAPVVEQPLIQERTGMTYVQITDVINEFIEIKPAEGISGQPRFLGTSENNLVILEIMGEKDNISQASIKLTYPKGIEPVNADLNNAMMLRFLRNIAPGLEDWPNRVKGIVERFSALDIGGRKEEKIVSDGKAIDILYDKSTDSIKIMVSSE